ncbi:MAG TPA: thiopurine S-methyltransferase [Balneolales bacterium]|nr:thiopurine S-methyltransferase [Balneolales bacterium]
MELSFWRSKWKKGQTGFHSPIVNPNLKKFWPEFSVKNKGTVLVPLCGKSLDMLWLRDMGYKIIGVEISEIACHDFFEENKLSYQKRSFASFSIFEGNNISIWQGDFFKLVSSYIPKLVGIYDRAALVALPEPKRLQYSKKILALSSDFTHIFLHTFEYPDNEMKGPPFSVSEKEIHVLYGKNFQIERLKSVDILSNNEKFQKRGLSELMEKIYHLHAE